MDAKKELIEILDYYKFKLKSGSCTMSEISSALKALEENMNVNGTISDFARFYDKPESQVRAEIARKLIDKPQRKLMYPFHKFRKLVPESWKKGEG